MEKKKKQRAAAAAVTAAVSAGVLVGGLFSAPAELLHDGDASAQAAVTETAESRSETAEENRSVRARLREWVLRLPIGVRALVGVPLWCVGWAALQLFSALWAGVLSPMAGTLAGWLCLTAVLLAVFAAVMKAMFPDLSLRRILRRRNLLGIALAAGALLALNALAPLVWDGWNRYAPALRLTGAFLTALAAVWLAAAGELRRRARERTRTPSQEEIRRRAREIADSVR